MLQWTDKGYILHKRPLGEGKIVLDIFTRAHGRTAGVVRGAQSKKMRGILDCGNLIHVTWQARLSEQLGTYSALELETPVAMRCLSSPRQLIQLQLLATVLYHTLPERFSYPLLYDRFVQLIDHMNAPTWFQNFIHFDITLLEHLGFGLSLTKCAVSGDTKGLLYVSPKTGCAVTAAAGEVYKEKLLLLPPWLLDQSAVLTKENAQQALQLTGYFLKIHYEKLENNKEWETNRSRLLNYVA